MSNQPIVDIARQIRPFLRDVVLAGARVEKLEQDIDFLLKRAESENIEDDLLNRLTEEEEIQNWLLSFWISDDFTRGEDNQIPSINGSGLLGDPGVVSSKKYSCPVFGCIFEFQVIKAGMPIPKCIIHNVALLESKE